MYVGDDVSDVDNFDDNKNIQTKYFSVKKVY